MSFFRHSDVPTGPHSDHSTGSSPSRRMSQSDELVGAHAPRLGQRENRKYPSTSSEQNSRANDILSCLQKGYESLDGMVADAIPNV